jgi:Tfp pilus assembly PilM family ATPase
MVEQTTLSAPFMRRARRFFTQRKTGWIGVDVGTSTIKLAQVECDDSKWRLIASQVIPIQDDQVVNDQSLSDGSIAQIIRDELKAKSAFRGRS